MSRNDEAPPTEHPAALGYRLPAEWEPHEATWIAWPQNREDWPGKFGPIRWVYAEIVRHLSRSERVRVLVGSGKAERKAADALKNLSNLRMVEGRQVCEMATNGSPDCQAAAESICKGKGFATGKSADVTTSRKCSARALLQRDESECRTETVVIKAACQ